jgi:hypothetical protein
MKYLILASLIFLVGCDKALHYGVGLGISTAVTSATKSPELGCAAAVVAGLAKEAVDFVPDPFDFVATAAGGCIDYTGITSPYLATQ